ncbi:FBP domain-containing protein [Nocardia puris]|uniref:Treble-clef zinc-finger protein n=1 Tax=Nocardia puris TaxID=208602 RepID=A0A366CZ60_9NOCA|nr:FBP domain-containing protein [Nocardia puris]MBF6211978.1 FBP domain-containing protein [Nocardia puris]MBF6367004.1 FBP domain-containing protein [Nocardia puris]MBF6462019.1 FBP domain-containing protein [Nocardia puris]RBO83091.1 treble-clef zinc-finger protein [Nocardia puris]
MEPVTERDIRSSFVNCSKGDAKRLSVPRDLVEYPWEDLDFLGWGDPSLAGRCYVVVPREDRLVGVALRHETGGSGKAQMCAICLTTHTGGGVRLMTANKAGESGRRGNSIGTYMCTDLACSLYARGKKRPALGSRYREDLTVEEKIARVRENMDAFLTRLHA